jgi:hypothetical protein
VYINEISVLWNPISARVSPTVVLYSDPNGDGNPMDMVPLRITPIYIPPSVVVLNNTTHQVYSITPTIVTGSFFVGAFLSDREFSFDPVIGVDTSHPLSNQSWIFENTTLGGLNLSSPQTTSTTIAPLNQYLAGNHMIRARYTPVPEPSAFFLAGMFVIGTYMRHRAAGRNT